MLLCFTLGCRGEREPVAISSGKPSPAVLAATSHRDLEHFFTAQNYALHTLNDGVPHFILHHIPDDLQQIESISDKKRLFFLSLLPMILIANDEIRQQRQELNQLWVRFDRGEELTAEEQARLERLSAAYLLNGDSLRDLRQRQRLLERIDILPPALVLAQAATESGFGTSRFARSGNNLFGTYTFTAGTGMVPLQRSNGRSHEIRRFGSVLDSIRFYMYTLNTHNAYNQLRRRRALQRALGNDVNGIDLTDTLTAYSERGAAYVHDLRIMIRSNRLTLFTDASLRPLPPQRPVPTLASQLESRAD